MDFQWSNTLKLSNSYWNTQRTTNAQITQIIKFRSTQYMGNYRKNLFCPQKFSNPNCTLCQSNDKDTWPHMLSLWNHKFLKGLRIARHNATTQKITNLLKSNTRTLNTIHLRCRQQRRTPPRQYNPILALARTCLRTKCICLARLCPNIMYIQGTTQEQTNSLIPTPSLTIQIIEFTFINDIFTDQAI